jgi:bleomycin hydrolase
MLFVMKKILLFVVVIIPLISFSQKNKHGKGTFKDFQPGFYHTEILPGIETPEKYPFTFQRYYAVDLAGETFPTDIEEYETFWHLKPHSQGNTGTCWAYAATSFFESEIMRLTEKEIDLSEMYTVYYEYVDRAKDFVKTRGETYYEQGSEAYFLVYIAKNYGMVPVSAYKGNAKQTKFHTHKAMIDELKTFLAQVKKNGVWNEDYVVKTVKSILNAHMGKPPVLFEYEGKQYNPKSFVKEVCQINFNEYFSFMSTKSANFYEKSELVEADNWRHDDSYYNLPVEDFHKLIVDNVKADRTICICGDVSEPGHDKYAEVAIIPDFDIPADYINDDSRQLRLSNGTTTDDHCIHVVGYQKFDDEFWYLIKDSGAGAFDGPHKGYRFYHEDYIKLKMMNILIHKDVATPILDKIIK